MNETKTRRYTVFMTVEEYRELRIVSAKMDMKIHDVARDGVLMAIAHYKKKLAKEKDE
jgi:hypothetical protein